MPFDFAPPPSDVPSGSGEAVPARATWSRTRLAVLGRYAATVLLLNALWEIAQLPLYTLWWTAPIREVAFAVVHCTAGDVLIAVASLLLAIALFGRAWPVRRFVPVVSVTIVLGLTYTGFSEWLNVYVRHTWAYTPWMPVLPGAGLGIAPLVQWIVVPLVGFAWMRRRRRAACIASSASELDLRQCA